jgi:SRSO17 transposase
MSDYLGIFKTQTNDSKELAIIYTKGLLATSRRNIERIDEDIVKSTYDSTHHFISESPWDHRLLMDEIAKNSYTQLQKQSSITSLPIGLYIDESSFAKKGTKSVGVSRQWLGSKGKVDNGQVAVFSAFGTGKHCALIDCRLYLPKSWTEDSERCDKAGVPEDDREYKTKIELAIESAQAVDDMNIKPDFYAVDALYGSSYKFMHELENFNKPILGRVKSNAQVYLNKPKFSVPQRKSSKGRKPTKARTASKAIEVRKIKNELSEDKWQTIKVRNTDRGELRLKIHRQQIWVFCEESQQVTERTLIISRENEDGEIKYSYTVASNTEGIEIHLLVQMDRQRYWIERSFQDAKNEAGLDEYQVRKFKGFYHHMALSMLAYLFFMERRIAALGEIDLLSCSDIRIFMRFLIAKKATTIEDLYMQMFIRHKKRESSIKSSRRRQADGVDFA